MLIAFEGPDNVGKSYSATALSAMPPIYNATKENYSAVQLIVGAEKGIALCFDRIDWLTHMVYRLALPDHEWNDARARTVFTMPDTHLVFKLHSQDSVPASDEEEGYTSGMPTSVNDMYTHLSYMVMRLNEMWNYSLFKTVTIMETSTDEETGQFLQRVLDYSSPLYPWGTASSKLVKDDQSLLELLYHEEANR